MASFIISGQMALIQGNDTIRTDLGSCIALCLWDPRTQAGGMNHYILPEGRVNAGDHLSRGVYANEKLIRALLDQGCHPKDLRAAVVGGSSVNFGDHPLEIGQRNLQVAVESLRRYKISLEYKRVGGYCSRSVMLSSETGELNVKEIQIGSGVINYYQHRFTHNTRR